jgi:predicted enzyme involved in methoxymalonyl-ACP biosynthesis
MADKYGDQGLSAVVILKYTDKTAKIDTFLMSCRVMGRYAENEIMAQVKRLLERKGIETVEAVYVRTAKNAPVSELFDKLGFHLIPGEIQENGERKDYEASVSALPETTGIFRIVTGV